MWVSRRGRGKKYSIYPLRFFCPVWHNRGEPNGSPWLTSGGRARGTNYRSNYCGREGRQTKSGSHPCFPFDPLLLASFRFTGHRSIHSIRIYVSNWSIQFRTPFLRPRSIFHRWPHPWNSIARNPMIPHLATNLANGWKKGKKRTDLWPDVETLNGKWTSVEFAPLRPPIPVVSYLRARKYVMLRTATSLRLKFG